MGQPTLTDVARQAGVSRHSAGFILAGKESLFRPETVQAVRAAAESLGYRPHGTGQALRNGRTNFVGLVQDRYRYRTVIKPEMIEAIEERLAESGLQLIYAALGEHDDPPELVKRIIADGLLINYHAEVPPALERATSLGRTPAVYLNIRRNTASVSHDERAGAEALTAHCFRRWGATAWVDFGPATSADHMAEPHHSIADRREGYLNACRQAGIVPRLLQTVYGSACPEMVDQLTALIASPDRPRALIISEGYESSVLAHIAAARCGLRVPDDLGFATFGSVPSDGLGWDMPMAIQRWGLLARTAVDLLVAAMAQPRDRIPATTIALEAHYENG